MIQQMIQNEFSLWNSDVTTEGLVYKFDEAKRIQGLASAYLVLNANYL